MIDLNMMDKHQLATELARCESVARKAQARQLAVLAEMHSRGTMAEYGYGSLETLQIDLLHLSRREAKKRSARAHALHSGLGVSGVAVAPLAPRTAIAFAAGEVSIEHVDEIVSTLDQLPVTATDEVEGTLVRLATKADPMAVRKAGRHAVAMLDPDGPEPADDVPTRPQRELYLQQRRDGGYGITGILDAETGHTLDVLLSPWSKPRPAENGERDARPPEQRRGDAFAELVDLAARAVDRPTEGGERPTVVVTMTIDDLMVPGRTRVNPDGLPVLADGSPISVETARRIACDAGLIPAVLGGPSETLDLGRSQRTATPVQRRALRLRDKGCIKCGRPDKWCHAHHLKPWADGGDTDVGNMVLLCSECHRLVHHADWTVEFNGQGMPECHPPEWMTHAQSQVAA